MDLEAIAKALVTFGAPLAALITVGGRRRRLRNDIKENLALIEEVEKHDSLREHTLASGWLQGRIALDIAKLTGHDFDASKKPIPSGPVVSAFVITVAFAFWTYFINRDAFQWYSVFPGIVSGLSALAFIGAFMNREIPPEE
jgi:hypothetical protein